MLITTCTHCLVRFRVTPQQLNLRQGQVRCGHCQKVFSGFEALERFPDDDTGSRILAARAAAAAGVGHEAAQAPAPVPTESPQPEALPEILAAEEAPPGPAPDPEPAAHPETPDSHEPSAARTRTLAALVEAYSAPAPPARLARAWVLGCLLLALTLALQFVFAFRAQIAQGYPATRPALEAACVAIGCIVPWVNDHSLLRLEDSELLEVPGKAQEIALGARIRNLAPAAQEFPHLELTLTDLTGQTAARRVLRPSDYLGRPPAPGEVMPAGSELAIQLRLETPRIKATGYELMLFYP